MLVEVPCHEPNPIAQYSVCAVLIAGCGVGVAAAARKTHRPPRLQPLSPSAPATVKFAARRSGRGRALARDRRERAIRWDVALHLRRHCVRTNWQYPTLGSAMSYGVYQISGYELTAQLTRRREGFPVSGFTATIQSDDERNRTPAP